MKPKKIEVKSGNSLEGGGIIVWIYHRKVKIHLQFVDFLNVESCINEALEAWRFAMENVQ
jgi:hypothetical protein